MLLRYAIDADDADAMPLERHARCYAMLHSDMPCCCRFDFLPHFFMLCYAASTLFFFFAADFLYATLAAATRDAAYLFRRRHILFFITLLIRLCLFAALISLRCLILRHITAFIDA